MRDEAGSDRSPSIADNIVIILESQIGSKVFILQLFEVFGVSIRCFASHFVIVLCCEIGRSQFTAVTRPESQVMIESRVLCSTINNRVDQLMPNGHLFTHPNLLISLLNAII
jgi:Mg2+/Co2+ transporter CorB